MKEKKCNLLCSAEFEYKTGQAKVIFKDDILEFNYEPNDNVAKNEYDLKFNSEKGFVSKFEFYLPSIHKIDDGSDDGPKAYDGELCIYHKMQQVTQT